MHHGIPNYIATTSINRHGLRFSIESETANLIRLAWTFWPNWFVTSFKIDSELAPEVRSNLVAPVVAPRHLGKPRDLAAGDSIVGDRSRSDLVSRIHRQAQESNRPFPSSRCEQFAARRE